MSAKDTASMPPPVMNNPFMSMRGQGGGNTMPFPMMRPGMIDMPAAGGFRANPARMPMMGAGSGMPMSGNRMARNAGARTFAGSGASPMRAMMGGGSPFLPFQF